MHKHHPPHHHGDGSLHSFMNGAFFGALVGTVLGLLIAPDSGKESRRKLKAAGAEAAIAIDDIKEVATPLVEELEHKLAPIIEKAKQVEGPVKAEMMEKIAQLFEEVDIVTDGAVLEKKDKVKDMKSKFFKGTSKKKD